MKKIIKDDVFNIITYFILKKNHSKKYNYKMWPKEFKFFQEFFDDFRLIFIFNTVKDYQNGLTFYDLKKYGNIPHSKIYRTMKALEEDGFLSMKKETLGNESGRPKHLFFLSEKGEEKLSELRIKIAKIFEFIKLRFPQSNSDLDYDKFLNEATFKVWSNPVDYILSQKISDEDKVYVLSGMESDLLNILEKVRKEKKKIEKEKNLQIEMS
ncbi:MAG: PadR family transcriptional regulator [Promethearchaeota archaeon]|jgi:DNA-binding PadR family transcriptional regulator